VTGTGERRVVPLMRDALYLGSVLVFTAGVQLFVLTEHTANDFAWTIAVPLTAAFLGAFYWCAVPLAFLSARESVWANARVAIPGVLVFLWATLATTVIHRAKFHFHSSGQLAKGAAWLWLIIYAADPILVSIGFAQQQRTRGTNPPRTAPLPGGYRAAIFVHGAISVSVGAAVFAAPGWVARWWPWPLTPLTGRAMGSWLLGLGVVLLTAAAENDWVRIRIATASYAILGFLELVAVARYRTEIVHAPAGWLFAAFEASVLALGVAGVVGAQRATHAAGFAARSHGN